MPSPLVILAFDHGTSGMKAALVSLEGKILAQEFQATHTQFLPGGGVEQDPQEWWEALLAIGKRLVDTGLVPRDRIAAVAVSSTFTTMVAIDREGEPVMNAITWQDCRGAPHVKRVMGGPVTVMGYSPLKAARWLWKTGGAPGLSGKDTLAHILFLQHEHPALARRVWFYLESKDYLTYRLTGQVAASYDSIALYWATDNRDIHHIHYDEGLIRSLGLERAKLPPLRGATEILGTLRQQVAAILGLPEGIPVTVGSADLQSAAVGSGAVRDFEGHVYVGTSSWILCHVPFKKTDPLHSIATLPSSIPGRYFCANEQDSAGGSLEFFIRNLLYGVPGLGQGAVPEDIHGRLEAVVREVPAGSGGVLFTPWLNGERTPVDDHTVRGGFYNLGLGTRMEHLARAVYEGVALNNRWVLGYVEKFIGRRMEVLNMVGGGAQSKVWCQIFADVLERPIRQVVHPRMANARGAAFIAGVALRALSFEDIPARMEYSGIFQPDPSKADLYRKLFKEFVRIYQRNKDIYRRLSRE